MSENLPAKGLTVDIVNEDTRTVNFGTSALTVYGDGTGYTTTVKATAGNGDDNWSYVLGWTANSSATGTKVSLYEGTDMTGTPSTKDLTSGGYFQLSAGKTYTLKITSSYTGSTQQTVKLNALGTSCTISVEAPERVPVVIKWATPIGTESNCPMGESTLPPGVTSSIPEEPKIREYKDGSQSYTLIDVKWNPYTGISFYIKPGCSYRLDSTTAYYYRTGTGDDAGLHQIKINGYYLVTANASYDTLLKSSISIGYSNDQLIQPQLIQPLNQ